MLMFFGFTLRALRRDQQAVHLRSIVIARGRRSAACAQKIIFAERGI